MLLLFQVDAELLLPFSIFSSQETTLSSAMTFTEELSDIYDDFRQRSTESPQILLI